MIVVKFQGGLGNQMFQYAVGKSLAAYYDTEVFFDYDFLEDRSLNTTHVFRNYDLDIFSIQTSRVSETDKAFFFGRHGFLLNKAFQWGIRKPYQVLIEPHFHFFPDLFHKHSHLYLDGYWQTEKYFASVKQRIKKDFQFKDSILPDSLTLLGEIKASESVCLNVRRTDYLQNSFHPVCERSYFHEGMKLFRQQLESPVFFIFSDDIDWCRQNFIENDSLRIVDHTHKGKKFGNYLQLMASCKHFIIPNSSYAWWAVWLANQKDSLVIAPQTWFNDPEWDTRDLIPEKWIRLPNL